MFSLLVRPIVLSNSNVNIFQEDTIIKQESTVVDWPHVFHIGQNYASTSLESTVLLSERHQYKNSDKIMKHKLSFSTFLFNRFLLNNIIKKNLVERAKVGHGSL
jgi:hypothetical protein